MNSATAEIPTERPATVRDHVLDAARHAAHVSHEAKLLKSIASDKVADGIHAAKRALKNVKRRAERVEDFKNEAALRIKRQPLKSVAIAAGVGLAVGACLGACVSSSRAASRD